MNSQMIIGGNKIEDTLQFKNAIEANNSLMKKKLQEKLDEIEKERKDIEEGKSQVEKYKKLLSKQKDIMIAMTNKLNERDEMILQLQEEIEAYDKINKEQEDQVEFRNERVQLLENILRRNNIQFPEDINNITNTAKINRKNENVYLPYDVEKNQKDFDNIPISMLNSEEN